MRPPRLRQNPRLSTPPKKKSRTPLALSDDQRAELWRGKLRSVARDHLGRTDGTDHRLPWGAALEHDGVWTALIEVSAERTFGQALVLAAQNGAETLDVVVESSGEASVVARRALLFDPSPVVWRLEQADGVTELVRAEPAVHTVVTPPELQTHIAALLALDDVDVITEHGSVIGECRGLEVARVTGVADEQRLDVGVGAYDQGAFAVINPDLTPNEALAEVVAQVLTRRRPGALIHPINRLARERWIRSELIDNPAAVGLARLDVVEPITAREGIKDTAIAAAIGASPDGETVLVACSVGIDLDAVPAAADLAELHDADRIAIVLPDRDRHPVLQAVAARSRRPIHFVTAPEPWSPGSPASPA